MPPKCQIGNCPIIFIRPSYSSFFRIAQSLTSDHIGALFPDVDAPFQSAEDAVDKLLPYHIFQHPREDLGKGKSKATEKDLLRQEIAGT